MPGHSICPEVAQGQPRPCWVNQVGPAGLGFLHEECDSRARGSSVALCGCFLTSSRSILTPPTKLLFSSLETDEETGAQRGDITG